MCSPPLALSPPACAHTLCAAAAPPALQDLEAQKSTASFNSLPQGAGRSGANELAGVERSFGSDPSLRRSVTAPTGSISAAAGAPSPLGASPRAPSPSPARLRQQQAAQGSSSGTSPGGGEGGGGTDKGSSTGLSRMLDKVERTAKSSMGLLRKAPSNLQRVVREKQGYGSLTDDEEDELLMEMAERSTGDDSKQR